MSLFVMTNTFFKVQDILILCPEVVLNRGIRVFGVKGEMSRGDITGLASYETSSKFYANAEIFLFCL